MELSLILDSTDAKIPLDLSLFIETKNPQLNYQDLEIPIRELRVYLNISSLINSKTKINKINLISKEINIEKLKKIVLKTKPSNLNSLIINKITGGKISLNLELYLNDILEIENFIAKGKTKEINGTIDKNLNFKNISFNFFGDSTDFLLKNIKGDIAGIQIDDGDFNLNRDENIILKSNFFSEIIINQKNIKNYSSILNKNNFGNQISYLNANFENNF